MSCCILDVYLSFLFVCTESVSDPTSRRLIRWLLFQTFIYILIDLIDFGVLTPLSAIFQLYIYTYIFEDFLYHQCLKFNFFSLSHTAKIVKIPFLSVKICIYLEVVKMYLHYMYLFSLIFMPDIFYRNTRNCHQWHTFVIYGML
jgi:hypothetical protein